MPDADDLRIDCLRAVHEPAWAGHMGAQKTLVAARKLFWWPGMRTFVEWFVAHCRSCQINKPDNQLPAGLLQPMPIPGRRWESVSMDLIVKLPRTERGHDSIVVFVDRLSKMAHLAACAETIEAHQLAQLFLERVFAHHGMPRELVSDRDSRFTSAFWSEVCRILHVKRAMSSAYHPETDGQTERTNRTLEQVLRHYVAPSQSDWDLHLPFVEFAINNAQHASTQATPFFLNYGQNPLTPVSLDIDTNVPAAEAFMSNIERSIARTQELLHAAQSRQKVFADRRRREVQFQPGDMVLLNAKHIALNKRIPKAARKLMPRFLGPFRITHKHGEVAYKLDLPANLSRLHPVFHVSLLKPYKQDEHTAAPVPAPIVWADDPDPQNPLFEIDQILAHRRRRRRGKDVWEFLVQWTGHGPEHNEWVEEGACTAFAITDYWRRQAPHVASV